MPPQTRDTTDRDLARRISRDGFAILPPFLAASDVAELATVFDDVCGSRPGHRDALALDAVRQIAADPRVRDLVERVLGAGAFAVRATLFDKHPAANWPVAWHQDTTIAVREPKECAGFGPWSSKEGMPHVRPPRAVLEQMLALRIQLDRADDAHGGLRVVRGSHQLGILDAGAIRRLVDEQGYVPCEVEAGGAMAMRPLLVHSSPRARSPGHRRVVHLEFAREPLPGGLAWRRQVVG